MDELNKWISTMAETPAGSVLMFLGVFIARIMIDQWSRRRSERSAKARKRHA